MEPKMSDRYLRDSVLSVYVVGIEAVFSFTELSFSKKMMGTGVQPIIASNQAAGQNIAPHPPNWKKNEGIIWYPSCPSLNCNPITSFQQ